MLRTLIFLTLIYTFSIDILFAQKAKGPKFSCDNGAIINLASPRQDIVINGFHMLPKQCVSGLISMIYVQGTKNSKRIDVTIFDTNDAVINQPNPVPGPAAQIKAAKYLANSSYKIARMFDSLVAIGQVKGEIIKSLSTIKKIRGFEVAVGILDKSPQNSASIYMTVKDRYVIIAETKSYMAFNNDHDVAFNFLSPFIEAISLEALR